MLFYPREKYGLVGTLFPARYPSWLLRRLVGYLIILSGFAWMFVLISALAVRHYSAAVKLVAVSFGGGWVFWKAVSGFSKTVNPESHRTYPDSQTIDQDDLVGLLNARNRIIKRIFDVGVSIATLALSSPLLLFIALLIRFDSPGPILFRQQRFGLRGQPFICLKFRTMHIDSDRVLARALESDLAMGREWAQERKLRKDPRVTRVGRVLRRYSFDELPQLLNVLRGDLSLVGSPAYDQDELASRGIDPKSYYRIQPGITEASSIKGRFGRDERFNEWYARNWSLWIDILTLVRAAVSVFRDAPMGRRA
jgi:lipopolysaccharide/colanic/teichoic acid biosynthesis glycosyltransferase